MLHQQLTKNLKEGERLIRIVRRDALAHVGGVVVAAGFILGDFFLLTWLVAHRPLGLLAFVVLLVISLVMIIRVIVEWQLNAMLVTSERIMHVSQRGLFSRTVSEARHENVTDVKFTVYGVAQTLLGLGTVEVQTAGDAENLRLTGVRRPSEVQAMITTTLRQTQRQASPLSAQELVQALGRMKDELGNETFDRAIAAVRRPEDD